MLLLAFAFSGNAAVFSVINTNDTGAGSLRQAIIDANLTAAVSDVINFALPGPGYTITLASGLPNITSPVTIDGTSQTGWVAGAPIVDVYLNGGGDVFSLRAGSSGSTLKGMVIEGGNRSLFILGSNSNVIAGNFIGTDKTGTAQGTTKTSWSNIQVENSSNNIFGGTSVADRNIISAANECGIRFSLSPCTGNESGTVRECIPLKLFTCTCGNALFFDNVKCLACGKETGWCPACHSTAALIPQEDNLYQPALLL